jgi:hypothetical protein
MSGPSLFNCHQPSVKRLFVNPAGPVDCGDLVGGASYFDQAHFGHEFRAFTRISY